MQVQSDQTQEMTIQQLQQELDKQKAENLQLKEQLARKEQFTAMIAHDLRAPLSPIINYAQMIARQSNQLKDGKPLTSEQAAKKSATIQRQTSIIISQAKRMSRQVNDLLDASNLSSGKFSLVRENCDLVTVVKDVVEQLRPVAPYHTLVVHSQENTIVGIWDGGRIQQALGNLIDNAIKYSDEHTTITVTVCKDTDVARVSVHNQGASIPSTDISQLFRPYTRLAAASASSRQGSGLGLFITKSIIEAHNGALRLEPPTDKRVRKNTKQAGTTFTFELPLA
ncbi:MAG TPA: HAMP domain-containing sensor histidine kinase [Dictyobacter sp.]|jgi:signal transduction histidine kinase|nr:HAMP domain-containing sensor histidine kinase [Dictyobacter sp.]